MYDTQNEAGVLSRNEKKVVCHKHYKLSNRNCTSKIIGNLSGSIHEREQQPEVISLFW